MGLERPTSVLIVDDDAAFRALIRSVLEAAQFTIVGEGRDGAEGVALARSLKPDVITMDLEMPNVDGVQATAELCKDGSAIVVIVSGSQSSSKLGQVIRAGARWYVAKRDVVHQLADVVAALAELGAG